MKASFPSELFPQLTDGQVQAISNWMCACTLFEQPAPLAIQGPPGSGKSLLAAVIRASPIDLSTYPDGQRTWPYWFDNPSRKTHPPASIWFRDDRVPVLLTGLDLKQEYKIFEIGAARQTQNRGCEPIHSATLILLPPFAGKRRDFAKLLETAHFWYA